jgi:hypothetical protein
MTTESRIDKMVASWNEEHRAFSHINNDDAEFFQRIGIDSSQVGTTSQTGTDIVYYNTEEYSSDTNAIRKKRKSQAERIAERLDEYFFKQLAEHPLPPYYVYTWSRDCDMAESSNVREVLTYIDLTRSYATFVDGQEWAEGPRSWELVDPQPEVSHTRDRVMEAFENGRGTSIFV